MRTYVAPRSSIEAEPALGSDAVDDHDEIWKPGYVGPPPEPSTPVDLLVEPPVEPPVEPRDDHTARFRLGAVPTAVVAAVALSAMFALRALSLVCERLSSAKPFSGDSFVCPFRVGLAFNRRTKRRLVLWVRRLRRALLAPVMSGI